jgi:hypothetical protein
MRLFLSFALIASMGISLSAQQPISTVSLTSFNAIAREKQVLLSWNPEVSGIQTYELEKSKNGVDFVAFGNMQGGSVNLEYLETDFNPFEGLSYYRLKLVGEDGTASYSNVVPVKYDENGSPVSPAPTAATIIPKDKSILVIVRSASGDEYYSKVNVASAGDPVECVDPDPVLNHGTYTIVGCSDQQLYAKQLVVQ